MRRSYLWEFLNADNYSGFFTNYLEVTIMNIQRCTLKDEVLADVVGGDHYRGDYYTRDGYVCYKKGGGRRYYNGYHNGRPIIFYYGG